MCIKDASYKKINISAVNKIIRSTFFLEETGKTGGGGFNEKEKATFPFPKTEMYAEIK